MNAITKEVRENAISDVKEGMSYLQAAKKHGVSDAAVGRWCHDVGVQSLPASRRMTDDEILDAITLHKAVACRKLAKILGHMEAGLRTRLWSMVRSGKLQSFRIPPVSHAARIRGIFRKYINTRIYYVSKDDLAEWVRDQFPKEVPQSLRRTVTYTFRSLGVDIFKKEDKEQVSKTLGGK